MSARMKEHINILGWIFIVYHALGIVVVIALSGVMMGFGILNDNVEGLGIIALIGSIFLMFMTVMIIPGIIAGIFLRKFKNWARILTLVLAFLYLFDFPLGTILGVYALWVLLKDETAPLFNPDRTIIPNQ